MLWYLSADMDKLQHDSNSLHFQYVFKMFTGHSQAHLALNISLGPTCVTASCTCVSRGEINCRACLLLWIKTGGDLQHT